MTGSATKTPAALQLGCIADDLTGATDIALALSKGGMRVALVVGQPDWSASLPEADAMVVALKTRTIPAPDAVSQSLAAVDGLHAAGAEQVFFKICSTFDSTDDGNIGPVAEALLDRLAAPINLVCPAFPENGRTVYQGNLFVNGVPLAESPMRDHPLTPMRESNLVRVLRRQTTMTVDLLPFEVVDRGADAVRQAIDQAIDDGTRMLIADAVTDTHLHTLGLAAKDLGLLTGGAGLAIGLPGNFRRGEAIDADTLPQMPIPAGRAAILAGSCSAATRHQVEQARAAGLPVLVLDAGALIAGRQTAGTIAEWIVDNAQPARPALAVSSADPEVVAKTQSVYGANYIGDLIEQTFANVAAMITGAGVSRLIVAGGETAGAVVAGLGVSALVIGPEIDPGVPWTAAYTPASDMPHLALALKSGNFGTPDFFLKAWGLLK